jgi:tetratricopeptide (TPR) repeat protein
MKPWFFFLGLLAPAWLVGQNPRVENLRKLIPLLKDSVRVDSMNEISAQYSNLSMKDSAEFYETAAYKESAELHYIHGTAASLSRKGDIAIRFYNNFVDGEKWMLESLRYYDRTANKERLAEAYSTLAYSCFAQSKYDEALKYGRESYDLYKKNQDDLGMNAELGLMSQIYIKRGEYDRGFDVAMEALQIAMKSGNRPYIKSYVIGLGELCMAIEDYPSAMHYYKFIFDNFTKEDSMVQVLGQFDIWAQMEYAEVYAHLNMFDSASYRYSLFDSSRATDANLRIFLVSKGEYYMLTGEYAKALPNLLRGLAIHLSFGDGNEIIRSTLDVAKTYENLHNDEQAMIYGRRALHLALQTHALQAIRDAYRVLFSVYDHRGQTDSAYHYYRSYVNARESLTDNQTKGKFAAYNYDQKIRLLNNEKLINQQKLKIQDQQLNHETLLRNILLALVTTVLALSFLLLRNNSLKRKNEKLKNQNIQRELQQKTSEMEMQALRSQMNPHFIFNCLNSINRFIMKNESQAASDYLTQFSRLIRFVLTNSKKAWIPLEDEIEMLRLYLGMEKLRFKDAFDYRIICDPNIDPTGDSIPPLLLQPFVENAIWHGLMHKKEQGLITISFSIDKDILLCSMVDNGVGRFAAALAGSKSSQNHKSMGIQITQERLALINGTSEDDPTVAFAIEDLFDDNRQPAGTAVSLRIKLQHIHENGKEPSLTFKPSNHD